MFGKIEETYIYCPGMVRSASTTISEVLSEYEINHRKFLKPYPTKLAIKNKHLPIEVMDLPENTFKFFSYRNPWSRIYSMYRWGLYISDNKVYEGYKNIDHFVQKQIKENDPSEYNPDRYRFWSALKWAGDLSEYDMVVPYTDVSKVFLELEKRFSIELKIKGIIHSTPHKKEKMSTETVEFIAEYYKDEIEYFNFKYEG